MIGLIGGTGLGDALLGAAAGEERAIETPYGAPSAPIRIAEWDGVEIAVLPRHGVGHQYNPSTLPYRANIYAMKMLGVQHIIASGTCGSLREDFAPRQLVVLDSVIDKTQRRTPTFFDEGLAVHCEFAKPYCENLRQVLLSAAGDVDTKVHDGGTYVCMEGPCFSTVAEAKMHQVWGGHVIGMTQMPEAKLAREAEIAYAGLALVTDYDCWKPHDPSLSKHKLLEEIIGHMHAASEHAVALLKAAIKRIASGGAPESDAHTALDLAVWTKPSHISPALIRQYGVLLERWAQQRDASA